MSEITRIVDQLSRAYEGEPWHGPALKKILSGITAEMASSHPLKNTHNIWELVLHTQVWIKFTRLALDDQPMPTELPQDQDWPEVRQTGTNDWEAMVESIEQEYKLLLEGVASLEEPDLSRMVAGRNYNFYFLLHGIIQHTIYHAGQISLLKSALTKK